MTPSQMLTAMATAWSTRSSTRMDAVTVAPPPRAGSCPSPAQNSADHANTYGFGPPSENDPRRLMPIEMTMPKIDTGMTQATPSAHGRLISYGQPDAHAPPMSITARIDW